MDFTWALCSLDLVDEFTPEFKARPWLARLVACEAVGPSGREAAMRRASRQASEGGRRETTSQRESASQRASEPAS